MTGLTRAARTSDFSWIEIIPAIVLIAALFFGGDWAGEAAVETDAERAVHANALTLAMSGSNALMEVPFERLAPTAGFVPVPEGLIPMAPALDEAPDWRLEIRVSDVDIDGRLRRVEVRVGWETDRGANNWVGTSTVRQDWAASHADSQRPRASRPLGSLAS